jgi:hypothetical protein
VKRDISKKPRMLTKSELESLSMKFKEAYKAFAYYESQQMEA